MKENFQYALAEVLKSEGGFVDHPKDPGGATNKGITLPTLSRYLGREATVFDLKTMTESTISGIYREYFWNAVQGNLLPSGLDYVMFDAAVNHGPGRAARMLQKILETRQDGTIGVYTIKRANAYIAQNSVAALIDQYLAERLALYQSLRTFSVFGTGWINRLTHVRSAVNKLI